MAVDINDTPNRVRYTATAGQTAFSVPFQFLAAADLKLYQNGTLKTLSTHYTVTGAGASSGTLTLVSGAALSDDILIIRDLPVERIGDFPISGPFDVESLNRQLDAQTMMVRDMETRIDRRLLRQPVADLPETLSDIPAKAARANLYLGFDANGQPKADLPNAAVIADYGERIGDLETISGSLSAVGTVADNIASVNTAAANIAGINNVSTAITNGDLLTDVYQGASVTNPTLRLDGSALQTGDFYFNTAVSRIRTYSSGTWYDTASSGSTDAALVSYSPLSGSTTTAQARLREFDALVPPTALGRGFSNTLPVGTLTPPVEFNDVLKLQRHYDGANVVCLQDPFDVIDFTKNPDTTINTYYVNYVTGNNANAGTSSGAAWKTLTYAFTTAASPAVIVVEDAWIGQNSLLATSNTLNGRFKLVSGHASGRTLFTNMNEGYTKATFNWLDETSGCWSTSTATTTSTIFGRLGLICFDSKYCDDRGRAMPLPQAASAAACIATPGTQFLDVAASKKYVHLIDGRTPDPFDGFIYGANLGGVVFLQSANDGVILLENFHSYMNAATAPLAGFRYRHSTTATNASRFGARNCIACGASANGFEIYDADVAVLSNCSAAYNRTDNFNYHSFQSTGTKGEYMTMYEYKCDGLQPGYNGFINQPALSASSNSSTCHDSIHIERTSCNHGGGNGATIADVNGCVSINWCVNAGPPTGGSPKACFWTEKYFTAGTYNGMWLWGCSAHDNQDNTIKLVTNEAQAGGSPSDGQVYVKNWRGKTGGTVTGTLKDFAGNNL